MVGLKEKQKKVFQKRAKEKEVNWKEGGFGVVVVMRFGERQAAEVQHFDDLTTYFGTYTSS